LRLTRTVALVGLMGAGKTNVGRRLATRLDAPFHDSDNEVERAAGMSVSDIFSTHGEPAFRDVERKVIKRLVCESCCVLATGGGAYMNPETRQMLADCATVVWLKASLPVLLARTSRTRRRPLLANGDAEVILADLIEKRYPVYAEAHHVIDSDGQSVDSTTAALLSLLTEKGLVTTTGVTGND
jgi:shikimate kinase